MNENVKRTCDLVVANKDALKNKMFWEADANTYAIMAGLLTASSGVQADPVKYQACKDILKKNAGFFSEMRGLAGAVVAIKMMKAADPEAYVQGVTAVYNKLREIHKLTASPYMVMAAINIYDHNGIEGSDTDIARLEELYKALKAKHPMLIGDTDRGFLSMIATSDIDMEGISAQIENAYEACKKLSINKNAIHSMAQLLIFSKKTIEEKHDFVEGMIKGLDKNHTPISKEYGLPVLGALSLLDIPQEQLIQDITDASKYLKSKSGFRWFSMGTRTRTVYAALAVFITYARDNMSLGNFISTNIAMNIAEQIVMLLIVIAISLTISASVNSK